MMPPTQLPAPLASVLDEIERQRADLINALSGLTPQQTMRSPGHDEWNAAQVVDHLLLAEGFTNDITAMLVGKSTAAGEATGFPADLTSLTPVPDPISMEAPPPIRPRQELPSEELIAALKAMGERTAQSFSVLATVDPRTCKMPHPLFGELDLGQWWSVIAMHYVMHIEQAQAALSGN
jgi:hypothetical protein